MCESEEKVTSDSEDEFNIEALEEAVDKQLFTNLFFDNNKKELKNSKQDCEINNLSKSYTEDEFQNNELTQSCKTFIAKKLNERLDKDVILKNNEISSKSNNCSKKTKGIRLFNSSTAILNKEKCIKLKKSVKKKQLSDFCDQEAHILKCKQVVVNTAQVLSQCDTHHWANRKPPKQYLYSKLANGKLLEIK